MHPSVITISSFLKVVASLATTSLIAIAAEPSPDIVRKLGSDDYPDRVEAEKQLQDWALETGGAAKGWLLEQHKSSKNPEVRIRSLSALKGVVLKELTDHRPGFVGITMKSVKLAEEDGNAGYGVEIQAISPDTPAEKAGLRAGDIIVELDGESWSKPDAQNEFARKVGEKFGGDTIELTILRSGQKSELELELAPRPWSAGTYTDNLQFRADPFAARLRFPPSEEGAKEEAFQQWLHEQEAASPTR